MMIAVIASASVSLLVTQRELTINHVSNTDKSCRSEVNEGVFHDSDHDLTSLAVSGNKDGNRGINQQGDNDDEFPDADVDDYEATLKYMVRSNTSMTK